MKMMKMMMIVKKKKRKKMMMKTCEGVIAVVEKRMECLVEPCRTRKSAL